MNKNYIKYFLGLFIFGTNGIVASFINLTSYEIVLFRTLIGCLTLMIIFALTKGKLSFYMHKKQFLYLALSGVAMGGNWLFLYEGYKQVGVGIASLLCYCGPVIVMALSPLLFKEKLVPARIIGFAAVVCGVFLISNTSGGALNPFGIFCGLMSAVMYAVLVILNKKARDITGLENAMLQVFFSFLTVAVYMGIKQGFSIEVHKSDVIPILVLGIINSGLGCYFYFSSIGRLSAQTVSICGYIEPLSAVIFSAIILSERMSALQLLGAVLILGGAVFGECFKSRANYSEA